MMNKIKRHIINVFNNFGYDISRLDQTNTMAGAIKRCADRGVKINTVIDVGASNGSWSELCRTFYPDAKYSLIEAQEEHKAGLESYIKNHPNSDYIIAAAGNREGKIFFDNSSLIGGLASDTPFDKNCIEVPVKTIDQIVSENKLLPPYLIKLDTHGYEVPIIEGAQNALKKTNLLIIETYNFKLCEGGLRYYEMCEYLSDLGFSSFEIVDLLHRKRDLCLWQMDIFYVPSDSNEFYNPTYD